LKQINDPVGGGGSHNGKSHRGCFKQSVRKALGAGGEDEQRGVAESRYRFRNMTDEMNSILNAQCFRLLLKARFLRSTANDDEF